MVTRLKVLTPVQYGARIPDGARWPLNAGQCDVYAVNSMYDSIQGEGRQVGTPVTVVRLQGCPVGCVWCDTPETWSSPTDQTQWWKAETLAAQVGRRWVLVTGGEPTWYDLRALTTALRERGIRRALETAGVYPITGAWDWVCLSPKPRGRRPLDRWNLRQADEVKWIVGRESDLQELEQFLRLCEITATVGPRVSLQPVSCAARATRLCVEALARHPEWYLSVQLQKYLGVR